ncbi:MAG: TetR/AcrR family transcriptional regulator [Erysipelotrichaceae bacterium]|nr:TetR/AcrR family transcriptional regulator [Erysipelotrichaceae bacterium]
MPPKPKFTKEEIVDKAFELVRDKGFDALTSRELGNRLGSSARPIFTVFKDMNEVKSEVKKKAEDLLNEYLTRAENYEVMYKQAIKETIQFASDEPNLFHLLFLRNSEEPVNFEFMKDRFKDQINRYFEFIKKNYQLNDEEAGIIFKHTCVYVYGVGAMCAEKVCTFSDDQLNDLLGEVFMAMLMYIKSGKPSMAGTQLMVNY